MKRVGHRHVAAVAVAVCTAVILVVLTAPADAQSAPPTTAPAADAVAPGAPAITSVKAGNEKATVSWRASAKKGVPPAAQYEVTPYRGTVAQPAVKVDAPATTATVTGLANKAKYTFKVRAIDAQGVTSKESIASAAVTPTGSGRTWYKSKRYWAAALVVLAALIGIFLFFFLRRGKESTPSTPAEPEAVPET